MFFPTVPATTAGFPIFDEPPTTQPPVFGFPTTDAPTTMGFGPSNQFTTVGNVATTAINMRPETTPYPQFQTTQQFIDYPLYPDVIPTTSQPNYVTTPQATMPPLTPPMSQNQGNPKEDYVAFRDSFLTWRDNVFQKWMSTARSYQEHGHIYHPV